MALPLVVLLLSVDCSHASRQSRHADTQMLGKVLCQGAQQSKQRGPKTARRLMPLAPKPPPADSTKQTQSWLHRPTCRMQHAQRAARKLGSQCRQTHASACTHVKLAPVGVLLVALAPSLELLLLRRLLHLGLAPGLHPNRRQRVAVIARSAEMRCTGASDKDACMETPPALGQPGHNRAGQGRTCL